MVNTIKSLLKKYTVGIEEPKQLLRIALLWQEPLNRIKAETVERIADEFIKLLQELSLTGGIKPQLQEL